jgi:uncharacterized membrane protein YqjE
MNSSVRPPNDGLASNAMTFIKSVLKLAGVRFSMATVEFADARDAFLRVLLLGVFALLALGFALLSISGVIVVLAWEALGWRILMILFFVYLLLTMILLWRARGIIASGKIGLPVTLTEMKKDRAALFGERDDSECR